MTKYPPKIVNREIYSRMRSEDVAALYALDYSPEAIPVTPVGEPPIKNGIALHKARPDRKKDRWYYYRVVDGKVVRISTWCDADDLSGALAFVLKHQVRNAKNAVARLAPESIPLAQVFDEYVDLLVVKRDLKDIKPATFDNYVKAIIRLNDHFGDATLADVYADGAKQHMAWCIGRGLAQNTAISDNAVLKTAINSVMEDRGSPYRVGFRVGTHKPRAKAPYEPQDIDAILATIEDGLRRGPDGLPLVEVDPVTGEARMLRVSDRALQSFYQFRIAVRFCLDSGTRSEATCEVTYVDPTGPFLDLDTGILNRRGEMTEDVERKRRGSCLMSPAFMDWLRPYAEDALARGETHLITDWTGRPLKRLSAKVWRRLQEAAGVRYRCVHTLKDTAVQIARREGVSLYDAAERFCTTPETLMSFYGADWDIANQVDPAEAMGRQLRWRATAAAIAARAERAKAARRERPLALKKARVGGNRGGGRRKSYGTKGNAAPAAGSERRLRGRPDWRRLIERMAELTAAEKKK